MNPADTMFQGLSGVTGAMWRVYLAMDSRVMYVSVNKNACTSLKWMMADIAGEDLSTFTAGWMPFINDTEAVHNRHLWKASPRLDSLTPEQRAEIHPENGWFIFAVVRDPRLRLFSAWQNKLLIETPNSQRWRNEAWYPRHPMTSDSVVADFAKFVDLFDTQPDHWLRARDAHFRDQVELLTEDAVPYSRIYEIGEIAQLRTDLAEHLAAVGRPRDLYTPRSNPTPLRPVAALFDRGVRERIERIYAADFQRFGHLWDFTRVESAKAWSDADIADCENNAVLGKRIAELHRMAAAQRKATAKEQKRSAQLESDLEVQAEKAGGSGRRLRHRLRALRSRSS
ncbi:sulfotransferase family 2 domain-containing protein [Ilumatobacter sp.]|uniref:sulfotransferase family 2 domain-containing protein n=1 Tax=Ilumatobacter sp. TaxID=1967498 RepID=UPI003C3A00E6